MAVFQAVWPPASEAERVCLSLELFHSSFSRTMIFSTHSVGWFDVGAVGELRVSHDGGRVGVDEDDAEASS